MINYEIYYLILLTLRRGVRRPVSRRRHKGLLADDRKSLRREGSSKVVSKKRPPSSIPI
jgi:hypothetical protein